MLNSVSMNEILYSMARDSNIPMSLCNAIIASLNKVYNQSVNYYENDAIDTFNNFIQNGVLNFSDYNIKF